MTIETLLKELTAAVKENTEETKKVNNILNVFPNPIDQAVKLHGLDKPQSNTSEPKETPAAEKETAAAGITIEELAELAMKKIQSNRAENTPKIKSKLDALGIPKVSATPEDKIEEVHTFLKGLK